MYLKKFFISALFYLTMTLVQGPHPVSTKSRFNISFAQLDTCDTLSIDEFSGYAYKDFFMVHALDNNNVQINERLHLKFYVLTSMNAHILLSVTDHPRQNDRVYEIVIGAGANTFSAIRTQMGKRRVAASLEQHLVSTYDPTPIEIVQSKDGDLYVYIPGFKKEPLLHFSDPSPLSINYISFSTFDRNSARWFYDCSFDGYSYEVEQQQRKQSHEERLLDALIYQSENRSLPGNLSEVLFNFQMRSLAYNPRNSLLHARMQLIFHWKDSRLVWNPESYGLLKSFEHPELQIWVPQILIVNGAFSSLGGTLKDFELRVYCNGNVTLMVSNYEVTSWCVDTARNWPDERVNCDIQMGIDQKQANLYLSYDYQREPFSLNDHVNTPSGWTFLNIDISHIENKTSSRYTPKGILQIMSGDMAIGFTLQRNCSFYRLVFETPIVGLSFLLRGYRRGALILIVLILSTWTLLYLTRYASSHYVPPLMNACQRLMRISVYCYLLHIAIMWMESYPPRAKCPAWLLTIINYAPVRFVLGLRLSDAAEYCDIQAQPWRHLSKILNNASFVVLNILFIISAVI